MNKICGYSCEHNKSGVCQISVCDKRLIISDKTEIKHLSQSYYDLHEKYYKLQKENEILKENAENNDKVIDKINWENQLLKTKIKNAIEYIKEKQKIQYKFALSHIECDDLLEILENKEASK